ncbi:MAG: DNA polymerase III subunit beta [Bacteroidales bacterium]|jgi:DNA polymerase-3 subunit beta|nr:DNA polymerase III subunit beta [Bacteroidales bacterium]MBQ1696001.1 DNA polymerase III subunit beta [Bacteroidales bacterium]MBQ3832912.1 DNA polymerase III subunit beta [Bacteroidales bacterium]MBQ4475666.1 DNA polymerase III subunit beta [Bacteroidales bacterium]MBQ5425337.1 DNA polymerase III subunit beta [Bacteroidales bacterium]
MDFVISSSQLLSHLQIVSRVVNSKNSLPILDNVLMSVEDGILKITASDLESTITTTLPLENYSGDGVIATDTKKILDVLKEFPEQPLTFNINTDDKRIDITSQNGKYTLVGVDGSDFPQASQLKADKTISISVSPDILYGGITSAIFATGDDELRPIMNGIFIELQESGINFVATDAHKLVRYTRKEVKAETESSFILPKKPANILKTILPKASDDVVLEFDEKNAVFTFGTIRLVCRLLEGVYPNYNSVIPRENPNKLVVDRVELYNSLRRIGMFASQSSNLVGLKINGNTLEISAQDMDFSISGKEVINCQYEGDEMEIGFKSNFLGEILSNISTPEVTIELSDPTRAGIILPKDNENPDEDVLMLLMPMMINRM